MLYALRKSDLRVPAGIPDANLWLTVADVAAITGTSVKTIRRWRAAGRLPPSFNVFGQVRWTRAAILEWMRVQSST